MAITSSIKKPWPICAPLALAGPVIARLSEHSDRVFADRAAWNAHLDRLGVSALKVHPDPALIAAEGALWGSLKAHGLLADAVIPGSTPGTSDDAGLPGLDPGINVGRHGLCWVHAERLIHKLDTFTDAQRAGLRGHDTHYPIWVTGGRRAEPRHAKRALAVPPRSPAAAIRRRSLGRNLFRLKWAVKGLDRRRRRAP